MDDFFFHDGGLVRTVFPVELGGLSDAKSTDFNGPGCIAISDGPILEL